MPLRVPGLEFTGFGVLCICCHPVVALHHNIKSVPFGTLSDRHTGIVSVEVLLRGAEETHIIVTRYVLIQSAAPALCVTHLTEDTTIR